MEHSLQKTQGAAPFRDISTMRQTDEPQASSTSSSFSDDDSGLEQSSRIGGSRVVDSFTGGVSKLKFFVKHTFLEVESLDNEGDSPESDGVRKCPRMRAASDSAIKYGVNSDHGSSSTAASTPRSLVSASCDHTPMCTGEQLSGTPVGQDTFFGSSVSQSNPSHLPIYENVAGCAVGAAIMYMPGMMASPHWFTGTTSSPGWAHMPPPVNPRMARFGAPTGKLVPRVKNAQYKISTKDTAVGVCKVIGDDGRTTLMIRNLPMDCTRDILLEILDSEGFRGAYDFLYFPMDFQSDKSFSYAFVNMTSNGEAARLQKHFHGFAGWQACCAPTTRVCDVVWSGDHQGFQAHIERYRNSPVMHADRKSVV